MEGLDQTGAGPSDGFGDSPPVATDASPVGCGPRGLCGHQPLDQPLRVTAHKCVGAASCGPAMVTAAYMKSRGA